ncbi:hypothetical protein FIP36_16595 [Salmonella enterica]|nr:hypothetical protein [Salmonella enterica]EEX1005123.1 hypothetical protein [Escherichia coli]
MNTKTSPKSEKDFEEERLLTICRTVCPLSIFSTLLYFWYLSKAPELNGSVFEANFTAASFWGSGFIICCIMPCVHFRKTTFTTIIKLTLSSILGAFVIWPFVHKIDATLADNLFITPAIVVSYVAAWVVYFAFYNPKVAR